MLTSIYKQTIYPPGSFSRMSPFQKGPLQRKKSLSSSSHPWHFRVFFAALLLTLQELGLSTVGPQARSDVCLEDTRHPKTKIPSQKMTGFQYDTTNWCFQRFLRFCFQYIGKQRIHIWLAHIFCQIGCLKKPPNVGILTWMKFWGFFVVPPSCFYWWRKKADP